MTSSKILGGLAIAFAAIMWGFDGVVLTPRLFNLNVQFVVFMLHALPFLLMNVFFYKQYDNLKIFTSQDIILLIAIAITGGALGTIAIVKALFLVNFSHLSVVVLLQKLQPVFAIVLASILLKEKITKRFIIWAIPAILGGYTLAFGFKLPDFVTNGNGYYAALYALLAAACFGSSTVLSKMALKKFSFKTVTFYRYAFTSLILLFVILAMNQWKQFEHITPRNWLFFIIIGLTTGSGAILLFYYGLNKVRAIISAIVELLFPISAIVFDFLINKNILTTIQWVSAFVMIFSIFKINDWSNKVNLGHKNRV